MTDPIKKLVLILLSAGWLGPLWLGCDFLLDLSGKQAMRLGGAAVPIDSFPFLHGARQAIGLAAFWLAAAISYWVLQWVDCRRRRPVP